MVKISIFDKLQKRLCLYCAAVLSIFILTSCSETCVKNHGVFAQSRLDYVIGQDGVSPIPFSNDITLWTFGDTILGEWKSDKKLVTGIHEDSRFSDMLGNSLAWTEKVTPQNVYGLKFSYYMEGGKVAQFIKNRRDEDPVYHRLWALDGIRIGNRVYVYFLHIFVPDHAKLLEFSMKYVGLARWDVPDGW